MEPDLATDPKHTGVLAELIAREPIFHRAEFGTGRSDFEKMTEADCWEVGASGRRYSRRLGHQARFDGQPSHDRATPWRRLRYARKTSPETTL